MLTKEQIEYENQLRAMDDPYYDSANINFAVSAKLEMLSKKERTEWIVEAVGEQDIEQLIASLVLNLDSCDAEGLLASDFKEVVCNYMRHSIIADYEELMLYDEDVDHDDSADNYEEIRIYLRL